MNEKILITYRSISISRKDSICMGLNLIQGKTPQEWLTEWINSIGRSIELERGMNLFNNAKIGCKVVSVEQSSRRLKLPKDIVIKLLSSNPYLTKKILPLPNLEDKTKQGKGSYVIRYVKKQIKGNLDMDDVIPEEYRPLLVFYDIDNNYMPSAERLCTLWFIRKNIWPED